MNQQGKTETKSKRGKRKKIIKRWNGTFIVGSMQMRVTSSIVISHLSLEWPVKGRLWKSHIQCNEQKTFWELKFSSYHSIFSKLIYSHGILYSSLEQKAIPSAHLYIDTAFSQIRNGFKSLDLLDINISPEETGNWNYRRVGRTGSTRPKAWRK